MKINKIFIWLFCLSLLIILTGCNNENNQFESKDKEEKVAQTMDKEDKILIVYFSQTGTTKKVSTYMNELLAADLLELKPIIPYTEDDIEYFTNGRADREQQDKNARVMISNLPDSIDQYDIILLGYPIWHGEAPRIINTFIESFDFSNKTIIPYCTSHSSSFGSSDTYLKESANQANWIEGKRFSPDITKREIEEWFKDLGLIK